MDKICPLSAKYPETCHQIDDEEQDGLAFKIEKGGLGLWLTAPHSEEWRRADREWAKKNGITKRYGKH
jgi:hypothetical protein